MKKLSIIATVVTLIAVFQSCSDVKREQNRVYMPDMAYSRAVETYSDHRYLGDSGIFYNATPVKGTVKRGTDAYYEMMTDTTGAHAASSANKNPVAVLTPAQAVEAERLYLVNCGICHGTAVDGNGPLYKDGNGPYVAKPANLTTINALSDGQVFHVITYGKNMMGSYASQISPQQRWMIVSYLRGKSGNKAAPADSSAATPATTAPATTAPATTAPATAPATN